MKIAAGSAARSSEFPARKAWALLLAAVLSACGGSYVEFIFFTVGGTVSGLNAGLTLMLTDNSSDSLVITTSGGFTFPTAIASGAGYSVTVTRQPAGESCSVANGSGAANADVTSVTITCAPLSTWTSGADAANASSVYATQGIPAAVDAPGARASAVSWIDAAGELWLFGGGSGPDAGNGLHQEQYNDLWRFSPGSGQWTWMSGSNLPGAAGVYGTQGTAAASNVPGARENAVSWTDPVGDLWLFGGMSFDSSAYPVAFNDLWRFSPATGQWTWISGSQSPDAVGDYGMQGTAAVSNVPRARARAVSWTDRAGNFWLFGGGYYDSTGVFVSLTDLWRYSPATGEWAWISGSSSAHLRAYSGLAD